MAKSQYNEDNVAPPPDPMLDSLLAAHYKRGSLSSALLSGDENPVRTHGVYQTPSTSSLGTLEARRSYRIVKLILLAEPGIRRTAVSEPGDLCLLPASRKLGEANLLPSK